MKKDCIYKTAVFSSILCMFMTVNYQDPNSKKCQVIPLLAETQVTDQEKLKNILIFLDNPQVGKFQVCWSCFWISILSFWFWTGLISLVSNI